MSGKGGRFRLREEVDRIVTEEKPAVKPKPPPKLPVVKLISKQPIVDGGPKTPAEKKEVKHDLSKEEELEKLLVEEREEDAKSDVEEKFDELFGDGTDTGSMPPLITNEEGVDLFGSPTGNETISISGTSEKLDFLDEEMPESPLMPESYEEEVTEELGEEDIGAESEISTSDMIEEEADEEDGPKPPPLTPEKIKAAEKTAGLPSAPEMPSAEPVKEPEKEATTGEAGTKEARTKPAEKHGDVVQQRAGAHTLIGGKPRAPEEKEDVNVKNAMIAIRALGGIYEQISGDPRISSADVPKRIKRTYDYLNKIQNAKRKAELLAVLASLEARFGELLKNDAYKTDAKARFEEAMGIATVTGEKKLVETIGRDMERKLGVKPPSMPERPMVAKQKIGVKTILRPLKGLLGKKERTPEAQMPQVVLPASRKEKEAPDDAETRAASTDEAGTKAVERKPIIPQAVLPASDQSRAAEESDETRAVTTSPMPTKKKLFPKTEMPDSDARKEILDDEVTKAIVTRAARVGITLEDRKQLDILTLVEKRLEELGLTAGLDNVVMEILKNNPMLLTAIVSGLIKNNDEVRNIIFNEQSKGLSEMRAMKKELDKKTEELKGLEARVRNTESMVERAEAAAEKAKDSASEVAGVKGYVDERVNALAEVVDEEIDGKVGALAGAVDEELKEKMEALGEAIDEELVAKTRKMRGYTDGKIEALVKDIDKELEEKKKEMESYVDGKVETLESAVREEADKMKSELESEIEKSAGKAKEEAIEDAKSYADSKAETTIGEAIKKMKDYTDNKVSDDVGEAKEEVLKTATERISEAVKDLSEKTVEPMQDALKTMLGSRYEKAELGKEVMDATAVTAVAGALSESRYIEMFEAFGKEYGNEVAKAALESISGMEPKKLAMSEQLYDENGELDVEKAETIIKRANNILNR